MAEISLITVTQIRTYLDLQPRFDQERFDTYVDRVQKRNLRDLLSSRLYYDMFNNVTDINTITAPYDDLIDGTTYTFDNYTINYYGIRPFLAFHIGAIMVMEGDVMLTDMGAHNYENNFSTRNDKKFMKDNYISVAGRYGNEIQQYLDEKQSSFSLWEGWQNRNNPKNLNMFAY